MKVFYNFSKSEKFEFDIDVSKENSTVTINKFCNAKKIIIPEFLEGMPVTEISSKAFEDCNKVKHLILPKSLTSIGEFSMFEGCGKLTEITVDENNPVFTTVDGVLYDKAMTTIILYPRGKKGDYTIPDTIFDVRFTALRYCTKITRINIPKNLMHIEDVYFVFCERLMDITVSEHNPYYSSIDGVLFNKEGTSLIAYPPGKDDTDYIAPNGVHRIRSNGFWRCRFLTKIILPEGLKFIEDSAFPNCEKLTTVTLPSSLLYIGEGAFYGCSNLKTITLSRNTKLGYKALEDFSGKLVYRD